MDSYHSSTGHSSQQQDAGSPEYSVIIGKMTVTRKFKTLAGYTFAYLLVAAAMMLADAVLTIYLLENSSNAYELNLGVDASSVTAILRKAPKSLLVFTGLFFMSLALCLADEKLRKLFQTKSRWDELFIRLPGAAAIWNLLIIFGALLNNGGMILFEYSWFGSVAGLLGAETDNEHMAAFVLLPMVSMVILIVPTYIIFSRLVDRAKRSLTDVCRNT